MVTHEEVRDWGDGRRDAMIVSVSHAWETREHPDPCRFQLQNLADCAAAYLSDLWLFFDYTSFSLPCGMYRSCMLTCAL